MSKKFLKLTSLVMAIVMMMSMIGLQVSAADAVELTETVEYYSSYSDTTYTYYLDSQGVAYYLNEGYVTVVSYTTTTLTETDVVIAGTVIIEGTEYDVTFIEGGAFYNSDIVSVVIPNTVLTIGSSAFMGCTSLETVIMGNSVTTLESNVFKNCTSLTAIELSESLESMYDTIFDGCTNLTSIVVPDSVTFLSTTFKNATGLTYLKLGNGLTSFSSNTVYNCTNLETLILGESITSLNGGALNGASNLKSVTIGASITSIGASAFTGIDGLENTYYTGTQEQWEALVAANPSAAYGNGTLGDVIAGTNTDVVVQCCAGHTVEDYLTFVSTTATADEAGVSTYLCECGHTVEVAADALGGDDSSFDLGSIADTFNTYIQAIMDFIQQIVEFFQSIGDMF